MRPGSCVTFTVDPVNLGPPSRARTRATKAAEQLMRVRMIELIQIIKFRADPTKVEDRGGQEKKWKKGTRSGGGNARRPAGSIDGTSRDGVCVSGVEGAGSLTRNYGPGRSMCTFAGIWGFKSADMHVDAQGRGDGRRGMYFRTLYICGQTISTKPSWV